MSLPDSGKKPADSPPKRFVTTRWSVVLAAGRDSTAESRQALETLCETYWQPLYFFLRRRGQSVEEAEDLIQGFFVRLLDKKILEKVEPDHGKFRYFLLAVLKNHLSEERKRGQAQKRGGGKIPFSLDIEGAEHRYRLEAPQEMTPDKIYARRWAMTVLERVLERLRDSYAGGGKQNLFERLEGHLTGKGILNPYQQIAEELEITEGAVKVAVHRLRKRFGDHLREEIAQTVATPEEVDEEIQNLRSLLE